MNIKIVGLLFIVECTGQGGESHKEIIQLRESLPKIHVLEISIQHEKLDPKQLI